MEAQPRSSRKRKQPSSSSTNSNPFAGILTRHKSQKFFFHHNRSGKSRRTRSFPSSLSNPRLPTNQRLLDSNLHGGAVRNDDDEDDDAVYNISIKDLRARRVFSKPLGLEAVGKNRNGGIGKNVNPNSDSELVVRSDVNDRNPNVIISEKCDDSGVSLKEDSNGGNPNLSMLEKCVDSRVGFTGECLNGGNPNLSMLDKCVDSRVEFTGECLSGGNPNLSSDGIGAKDDCGGRVSDGMSPGLSTKDLKGRNGEHCEEDVQMTPPDAVVLVRQIEDQSVLQSRSSDSRLSPNQISPIKGGSFEGKKSFPTSRRNLVLNPCSKLKVFKAPNSFSYRRLLPYLMDLAKDKPSASKVNPSIIIETDVKGKPLVSSTQESVIDRPILNEMPLATIGACKPQEMNVDSKEEGNLALDPKTNNSGPLEAVLCTPLNCPIEKSQESSTSEERQIETPVSDDSKNVGASPDRQISLDDISPFIETDLAATMHSPKKSSETSGEDAIISTPYLSPSSERECRGALIEFKSEKSPISVFHSSSKLDAVVSPDESGSGLAKGILKRNPRGCRGICNCLNCASFRLNAEKAFEFSRNQWLDAEELATDMMEELSNLRRMLENSVNGAVDNAIVPVDQVQEVCRRASQAEDTARSRLIQMKDDLNAHCRTKPLQRPRVSFSSSSQEKIIGGTSPS